MVITISPSSHHLAGVIKKKIDFLLKTEFLKSNCLSPLRLYILKGSPAFSWSRNLLKDKIGRWDKINAGLRESITKFSTEKSFHRYLVIFKSDRRRYKYIFFLRQGLVFINCNYKKREIVYFAYEKHFKNNFSHFINTLRIVYSIYTERFYSSCPQKSLLLHASGVERNGKGYVFLGESGAGKSTICRLSEPKYNILNDDKISIEYQPCRKRFIMYALDCLQKKVGLEGIFFIRQSKRNKLKRVGVKEAIKEGLRNPFDFKRANPFHNFSARKIDLAFNLFRRTPSYHLYFRKEPSFWALIEKKGGNL